MMLELKITCTCHQAKIAMCCPLPLVVPIAQKNCTGNFSTHWIQVCNQIFSLTTPTIQALKELSPSYGDEDKC